MYGYPYFKTWLIFTLVSGLIGAGVSMLVGAIVLGVMGGMGFEVEDPREMKTVQIASGVASLLVTLPISFVIFRWSVAKFLLGETERTDGPAGIDPFFAGGPKA